VHVRVFITGGVGGRAFDRFAMPVTVRRVVRGSICRRTVR
jgi:hypothetical protein